MSLQKKWVEIYEKENNLVNNTIIPKFWNDIDQNHLVVSTYEKIESLIQTKGLYLNPFIDGIIMPCCGEKYCFSYDAIKYLPKNNNLTYRYRGDIDYDPNSKKPRFVEYNNAREAIRQAKQKGLNHVHWRISQCVYEELIKDGYKIHWDLLDTISW